MIAATDAIILKPIISSAKDMKLSCVHTLHQICQTHQIFFNLDGKPGKILSMQAASLYSLQLCSLLVIASVTYLIKQIPYRPITVMGDSIYSRVAAYALRLAKVDHVLCQENNRTTFYLTTEGIYVPFQGVNCEYFPNDRVPIILNTPSELSRIERHIGHNNLGTIQNSLVQMMDEEDGLPVWNFSEVISAPEQCPPVVQIRSVFHNLYLIRTHNEQWISRHVITDSTTSLQPADRINRLYQTVQASKEESHISVTERECTVSWNEMTLTLSRDSCYQVDNNLAIIPLKDDMSECLIYQLDQPRMFRTHGLYVIHPFHLPPVWDSLWTIMLVTLGSLP